MSSLVKSVEQLPSGHKKDGSRPTILLKRSPKLNLGKVHAALRYIVVPRFFLYSPFSNSSTSPHTNPSQTRDATGQVAFSITLEFHRLFVLADFFVRFRFNLTDTFARHTELLSHFFQRMRYSLPLS